MIIGNEEIKNNIKTYLLKFIDNAFQWGVIVYLAFYVAHDSSLKRAGFSTSLGI